MIEALIGFFCGFQCIVPENADVLGLLGRFRDEILAPDDLGRDYSKQYHEFLTEIVRIMASEPMLLLRAREKLLRHTTLIEAVLNGQPGRLTRDELRGIVEVLEAFEATASPELRETIERLKNDLANPEILARLGFTIQDEPETEKKKGLAFNESARAERSASAHQVRLQPGYGRLALSFEANRGQAAGHVDYLARGRGLQLYLTAQGAVLVAGSPTNLPISATVTGDRESDEFSRARGGVGSVVRMQLLGSNRNSQARGLKKLRAKSHYIIGADPARWRTNVPHYEKILYKQIYPGVDLVYYSREGQLECDFIVAPGASPEQITLAFQGTQHPELDSQGDLLLRNPVGDLRWKKPYVYQEIGGGHREIASCYKLKDGGQVGFEIEAYDRGRPLVIDPVLSYSSFLGGTDQEVGMAIAVDGEGNAYLTGATTSADFPTESSLGGGLVGGGVFGSDGFVTKLNADGTELIYSTYFGGSGDEISLGVAVDTAGNAYIAGATSSADFPTAQPIQAAFAGGGESYGTDAFVLKLNPAGSELVYSTYLGGAGDDGAASIALDGAGNVYLVGATASVDFPTAGALQAANGGGETFGSDAFVAKVNAAGTALAYATFLGGSGDEAGVGIAVDGAGNAYVTGLTYSADFPTMAALQEANGGSADVFVTKLNAAGSALVYSSYLGGQSDDFGFDIALDAQGNAYLTGLTGSTSDFPLLGPAQAEFGSEDGLGFDAFVAKVKADGSELVYSTSLLSG